MKSSQIKQLLPRVFQAAAAPHTPLDALLHAMEALHAPAEERLAAIEAVFNAHSAPTASWPISPAGSIWTGSSPPRSPRGAPGRLRTPCRRATGACGS